MKCPINLAHFLFNLSQKENQVKILDPCLWPGGSYKFRSVLVLPVCLSRSFLGIDFLVFSDMQLVLETCMRLWLTESDFLEKSRSVKKWPKMVMTQEWSFFFFFFNYISRFGWNWYKTKVLINSAAIFSKNYIEKAMFRGEISAVMTLLMSKCYWIRWKW